MRKFIIRVGVVLVGVITPIVMAYWINSSRPDRPLDLFMVLGIELACFALMAVTLRLRPLIAVLAALVYFPFVFAVIILLGFKAGYYDMP